MTAPPDARDLAARKYRKSEVRQRQKLVCVRFNRDEYGALVLTAAREGKPVARVLRDAFLATISREAS